MAVLVGGFGIQFEVTNPLMAARVFHVGSVGFGALGTLMAGGGIIGNVYSARRRDPGSREFAGWAAMFGAAEVIAAVMPTAWAYGLMLVAVGAATQLFATSATVYIQQAAPDAQRAHALSAYNAGFIGFVPAGSFVVAAVAAGVGIRWSLIGPGAVITAAAIAALATTGLWPRSAHGPGPRTPKSAHGLGLAAARTPELRKKSGVDEEP